MLIIEMIYGVTSIKVSGPKKINDEHKYRHIVVKTTEGEIRITCYLQPEKQATQPDTAEPEIS